VFWRRGGLGGPAGYRDRAPPGLWPAAGHGEGDGASADRAGVQLRAPHQGRGPGGCNPTRLSCTAIPPMGITLPPPSLAERGSSPTR